MSEDTIIKYLESLEKSVANVSLEDYCMQYFPSGVVLSLDYHKRCDLQEAMDILYEGTKVKLLIEKTRRRPICKPPAYSFFDISTLKAHETPRELTVSGLSETDAKEPFKKLLGNLVKRKRRNLPSVLHDVMISEDAYSRLNTGHRKITLEILALFSLALHLSTDEAYDFITKCDGVEFNSATTGVTYAGLMYSLEKYDYDTIEFTECCFNCIKALHGNVLPSNLRNWLNDYERFIKSFDEDPED